MGWQIKMNGNRVDLRVTTYGMFVVVKPKSEGGFRFSYVITLRAPITEYEIHYVGGVTLKRTWI